MSSDRSGEISYTTWSSTSSSVQCCYTSSQESLYEFLRSDGERGINVRAFYKSQVQSVYASDFTVSAITSHSEIEPSRYLLITMAADGAAVA
jgi:hypothetical protein